MFNRVIGVILCVEAGSVAEDHPEEHNCKGYVKQQRYLNKRVNKVAAYEREQARENTSLQAVVPHNPLCRGKQEPRYKNQEQQQTYHARADQNRKIAVVKIRHKRAEINGIRSQLNRRGADIEFIRSELHLVTVGELNSVFKHIKAVVVNVRLAYSDSRTCQKQLGALTPENQTSRVDVLVFVLERRCGRLVLFGFNFNDRLGYF